MKIIHYILEYKIKIAIVDNRIGEATKLHTNSNKGPTTTI